MKVAHNLAFGAKVTASSYYDKDFRPEYAVDDNNGTLWRPRTTGPAWIQLDLGKKQSIKSIWTQFEYGTQFYQYLIETSNDGTHWQVFSDKRQNRLAGSPMVDFGEAKVDSCVLPIRVDRRTDLAVPSGISRYMALPRIQPHSSGSD